ncbi:MAG: NUDIX domain-containing protein [Candidatus Liptonbacteria bacterium]|nr:NUDIX domain-containing protein [Candidatus Liptonbacteria bacterium]
MKNNAKDVYYVAVKVFLRKGGKLFIFEDSFKHWDIPGGRILPNEFNTPLEKILQRKVKEELGSRIKYDLGKPVVFMRHERKERMPGGRKKARIFAVGYRAKYIGGTIRLSKRHSRYLWISVKNFKPEKYFSGGWLEGVQKYLKIAKK